MFAWAYNGSSLYVEHSPLNFEAKNWTLTGLLNIYPKKKKHNMLLKFLCIIYTYQKEKNLKHYLCLLDGTFSFAFKLKL